MNMKKAVIIISLVLGWQACQKNNDYQSTGVITGPDMRECICCGGYFIEINDSTYNFDNLPNDSQIDLAQETFPLAVKLDWDYDRKCGGIQYITISRISKK